MAAPPHLAWLVNTGKTLKTTAGHTVEQWELKHGNDPAVLSAWAEHFREHYCDDKLLQQLVNGTGLTNREFLIQRKFPDANNAPRTKHPTRGFRRNHRSRLYRVHTRLLVSSQTSIRLQIQPK